MNDAIVLYIGWGWGGVGGYSGNSIVLCQNVKVKMWTVTTGNTFTAELAKAAPTR